jgi:hypothetical protein
MNIETKIEKAHFTVTEQDIELLAQTRVTSDEATKRMDGTYLRILVATMQGDKEIGLWGRGKRALAPADIEAHRAKLADIHAKFYPAVLRGVTTADVADKDGLAPEDRRERARVRNSRATFARSAASTLQAFIKLGGDVRKLDPKTMKKMDLQRFIIEHREPTAPAAQLESTANRLIKDAADLLAADPDAGRVQVEHAIAALQALLGEGVPAPQAAPRTRDPTAVVSHNLQVTRRRREQPAANA